MEFSDADITYLLGDILIVDTFRDLQGSHKALTSNQLLPLVNGVLEGLADIHSKAIAKKVRHLLSLIRTYRTAWKFIMAETDGGPSTFLAACEETKIDPGYLRRKVKEMYRLPFSPLLVDQACTRYMTQREHYAGKGSRGKEQE